tara:strand:- start:204 stop:716 length:513 start_codon:yes stop_codon:yes gene_type:complete
MAINFSGGEQTSTSIPLQVKTAIKKDTATRNGNMGTISGLSVAINPSSTESRFMIFVTLHGNGNSNQRMYYGLQRHRASDNSNVVNDFNGNGSGSRTRAIGSQNPNGGNGQHAMGYIAYDQPGTTSTVTYYVLIGAEGNQPFYLNRSQDDSDSGTVHRTASSITVMEFGS